MTQVRASAFIARVGWIRQRHGDAGVEKVLAAMSDSNANAVRAAVNPTLWVPFDAFVALGETIDRLYGAGDLRLCRDLGRHAARANLPLYAKIYFKFGSVRHILSKAAALWSAHYDSGLSRVIEVPGGFAIRIERFATPHKVHCFSVLGWMDEMVALTGVKVIDAKEAVCRLNGGDACEFRVTYE